MPRFYFHIRDGERLIEDPDGSELPDLEAARVELREATRNFRADRRRADALLNGRSFEIVDEAGRLRAVVPFGDVIWRRKHH